MNGAEDEGVQAVTRPSAFVVAVKATVSPSLVGPEEESSVKVTGISAAGRPVVVSRTWQVIGGREAIGGCLSLVGSAGAEREGEECTVEPERWESGEGVKKEVDDGDGERWEDRAARRWDAGDMRLLRVGGGKWKGERCLMSWLFAI